MDKPEDFKIAYMRLPDVEAAFAKRNPRLHDVPAIAESIRLRGFNAPPLVNERDGKLVYGHGRTKGVRWLYEHDPDTVPDRIRRDEDGMWMLPVFRGVSFKSKSDAEEYLVADNRIGELSSWEPEGLVKILERIRKRGKLAGTGYTSRNVDKLLAEVRQSALMGGSDVVPDLPEDPVSSVGDTWIMGEHKLVCGDCRNVDFSGCETLFYDPPWDAEAVKFATFQDVLAFCDGYRAGDVMRLFGAPSWVFVWDCVTSWYTPNRPLRRGKMCLWFGDLGSYEFDGSHYGHHASTEVRSVTNTRGTYSYKPDPRGKHLSDVFQRRIMDERADSEHAHSKPVDWVRMLIGNCTKGAVADPFCGSGTSIIACEQLGRSVVAAESDPRFCDVIVRRWEKMTGQTAVNKPRVVDAAPVA